MRVALVASPFSPTIGGCTGWLVQHWFAVVLFAGYTTLLIIHARAGLKVSDAMGEYFVGGRWSVVGGLAAR